jgi:hypothetical protein
MKKLLLLPLLFLEIAYAQIPNFPKQTIEITETDSFGVSIKKTIPFVYSTTITASGVSQRYVDSLAMVLQTEIDGYRLSYASKIHRHNISDIDGLINNRTDNTLVATSLNLTALNGVKGGLFDATKKQSYVNSGSSISASADGFFIMANFVLKSVGVRVIASKDNSQTTLGSEYYLGYYPGYSGFVFQIEGGNQENEGTQLVISKQQVVTGKQYTILGWYDKILQTVNIMVNGILNSAPVTENNIHATDVPFSIGSAANKDPNLSGGFFDGQIFYVGLGNVVPVDTKLKNTISITFTPKSFSGILIGNSKSASTYIRLLNSTTIRVQGDVAGYKDFTVPEIKAGTQYKLDVLKTNNSISIKLNGATYPAQIINGDFHFNNTGIYWNGQYQNLNFDGVINSVLIDGQIPEVQSISSVYYDLSKY